MPNLPLFNRLALFVLGILLTTGSLSTVISRMAAGNLGIAEAFVFVLCTCAGFWSLWLSLTYRTRDLSTLEYDEFLASLKHSEDSLVCQFTTGLSNQKNASVIIDSNAKTIHFQNCLVRRGFLALTQPLVTCSIADVKGAHTFGYQGQESLTIVTRQGKALIPAYATNYARLCNYMAQAVPESQPGFATDHPMMGMVWLIGALSGLFAGFALTPRNANNDVLGIFVLCGAFLGVVTVHMLVWLADRMLGANLARPIGYATVGAVCAMGAGTLIAMLTNWNAVLFVAIVAIGGLLGLALGKPSRLT